MKSKEKNESSQPKTATITPTNDGSECVNRQHLQLRQPMTMTIKLTKHICRHYIIQDPTTISHISKGSVSLTVKLQTRKTKLHAC